MSNAIDQQAASARDEIDPESLGASTSPKGGDETNTNDNTTPKTNDETNNLTHQPRKNHDADENVEEEDAFDNAPELVAQTEFEEVVKPINDSNEHKSTHDQSKIAELASTNVRQLQMIKELQQAQIVLQNEKEEELRKRLSDQLMTIADKERNIEGLQVEVDRRSDAIRSCGEEIVNLRRENVSLGKSRDELGKRLEAKSQSEENEMKRIKRLVEGEFSALDGYNVPPTLLNQMRILTNNFQEQSKLLSGERKNVKKLQSEMDGMLEIGKQNKELVRASAKQSKQLGKMGKLEDKLAAYKSTVAMQEKVS